MHAKRAAKLLLKLQWAKINEKGLEGAARERKNLLRHSVSVPVKKFQPVSRPPQELLRDYATTPAS